MISENEIQISRIDQRSNIEHDYLNLSLDDRIEIDWFYYKLNQLLQKMLLIRSELYNKFDGPSVDAKDGIVDLNFTSKTII